jgi:hypothetical protein
VLELPNNLSVSHDMDFSPEVQLISRYFPNLKWLSMPLSVVADARSMTSAPRWNIPSALEELVLTNAEYPSLTAKVLVQLSNQKAAEFPLLSKISCYYGYWDKTTKPSVLQSLKAAGIDYSEYIPQCCNFKSIEFWHPWRYTLEQHVGSEKAMHDAWLRAWRDKTELLAQKRLTHAERRLTRAVDKGLKSFHYLFSET